MTQPGEQTRVVWYFSGMYRSTNVLSDRTVRLSNSSRGCAVTNFLLRCQECRCWAFSRITNTDSVTCLPRTFLQEVSSGLDDSVLLAGSARGIRRGRTYKTAPRSFSWQHFLLEGCEGTDNWKVLLWRHSAESSASHKAHHVFLERNLQDGSFSCAHYNKGRHNSESGNTKEETYYTAHCSKTQKRNTSERKNEKRKSQMPKRQCSNKKKEEEREREERPEEKHVQTQPSCDDDIEGDRWICPRWS